MSEIEGQQATDTCPHCPTRLECACPDGRERCPDNDDCPCDKTVCPCGKHAKRPPEDPPPPFDPAPPPHTPPDEEPPEETPWWRRAWLLGLLALLLLAIAVVIALLSGGGDDGPDEAAVGGEVEETEPAADPDGDGAVEGDPDAEETASEPDRADETAAADEAGGSAGCTPASELVVSSEGEPANVMSFCIGPLQYQEVGGDDPLQQLHTNREDLFLSLEAYTVYGEQWTGQEGTFPLECGEPWGLCLILDLDGAGPMEPLTWFTGGEVSIMRDPFTVCLHGGHEYEDPTTDTTFRIEQDVIMAPWVDDEIFDGFESCDVSAWSPGGE